MEVEAIKKIVEETIEDTSMFLVDLWIDAHNNVFICIDSDTSVSVADCMKVNRAVESNFDKELENYQVQVSSPGVGQPLKMERQYIKNVGRKIKVTVGDELIEGVLKSANSDQIEVEQKKKEAIEGKKGKKWVTRVVPINYSSIKEAKIQISFN